MSDTWDDIRGMIAEEKHARGDCGPGCWYCDAEAARQALDATPGPWVYDSGCVYAEYAGGPRGGERVRLALMDREEPGTAPWERDANARLMARAPDLLAALANLLDRDLIRGPGDHLEEVAELVDGLRG